MRADVPVACHLSGGLDSSAVTALAARHSSKPLDCFTVSFDAAPYDELRVAEESAKQAGVNLHAVRVTQDDLVEALPDAVYYSEGLAINGHLPAKFLLSRAIRRAGYRVVLTGEGSDEVLAGYAHLRRDLLVDENGPDAALHRLAAGNQVSAGIMLPKGETLPLDAVRRVVGFVPSFLEAKGTLGHRIRGILSEEFLRRHADRDPYQVMLAGFDVPGQLAGRSRVDQSLYLWNKTALPNYILKTLGDGTEMAHSVEGRLPFLDHPLFEYARSLPLSLKIRGGVEKYVLREAVRPLLTETVYRRQKHPFLAPPVCRFGTPHARSLLHDLAGSERFNSLPFFDRRKLLAWLDRLPQLDQEEQAAADPVLMTALCAALLHERFHL
jgi:asparagine synthase (glutamine-hydrolysing)